MRYKKICSLIVSLVILAALPACSGSGGQSASIPVDSDPGGQGAESVFSASGPGQIYLYGEEHGVKKILDKEFELWHDDYYTQGMRHLFIELPYYTAEFLNVWMQADDDAVLDAVYDDWDGAADHTPDVKAFYQKIKSECPETVFHGTDVGHQYATTRKRFLQYLEERGETDSEQYQLAQEAIYQGEVYYGQEDDVYRENKMVENFTREFDQLDSESVMGIYGSAHTGTEAMDHATGSVPCMANQLSARYGASLYSEDISWLAKDIDPIRVDTVTVAGKEYQASYFGKEDLTGILDGYLSREFWRLENAYGDFDAQPKTGDVLPYDNFRMLAETGQVLMIDYTQKDGSVTRQYYRTDGYVWNGKPSAEEFSLS